MQPLPVFDEGARRFRGPFGQLAVVALCALLAALVVSSYSVAVVIDEGHGNTGDETDSLTRAWTAYSTGIPSYGVLSDGRPWTLGGLTLPIYYGIYGARLAHVDPEDRIDAGRGVSRVLVALALLITLVALARAAGFPQLRDRYGMATFLLSVTCVCFLFAAHQSFVFVSSFGRVDAIGLLAVCLSATGLAAFRRSPGFTGLSAYALTVVFAYFSNHIAFVLVSALFALTVAAQLRQERLATYARALGVTGMVALVFDRILNHVWLTPTVSTSTRYPNKGAVADDLISRVFTSSPRAVLSSAWESYPELIGTIVVTLTVATAFLLWARGSQGQDAPAPFSVREVATAGLVVPLVVGWLGLTTAPTPRIGYAPMLLLAVALPFLLVACGARGIRAAWTGPVLLLAVLTQLSPSIWPGHSGRPAVIGATPRWQEAGDAQRAATVLNTIRQEHLQSLEAHLGHHHVSRVLTDDPLFALRNRSGLRYFFLYQVVTTPREEWRVLREVHRELGTRSLVTNAFGRDSFLRPYGYPRLKRALSAQLERATVEVMYPEGVVVARRTFVSRSQIAERDDVEYSYFGPEFPATPFAVYSLRLRPNV